MISQGHVATTQVVNSTILGFYQCHSEFYVKLLKKILPAGNGIDSITKLNGDAVRVLRGFKKLIVWENLK